MMRPAVQSNWHALGREALGERSMDDDLIIPSEPSSIYELWLIATYSYGQYQETVALLQADSIKAPHVDCGIWEIFDMAECAQQWLTTVARDKEPPVDPYQVPPWAISFWNSFKTEFRLLVCTKDKKYKDLRSQIARVTGQKGQLAIMSAVASGLAVNMGATVSTVLTPLCAICFLAGARIGRELLCNRLAQPGFQDIGVKLGYELPVKR
jgi:hypothetical protein